MRDVQLELAEIEQEWAAVNLQSDEDRADHMANWANGCADGLLQLARQPWLLLPELVWTQADDTLITTGELFSFSVWEERAGEFLWRACDLPRQACESIADGQAKCREYQIEQVKRLFDGS